MYHENIKGKWALITGTSRGIGQQIALGLAKYGCNIILHASKVKNCEKTESLLKPYNVEVKKLEADLSSDEEIGKMINDIQKDPGYVDILYNNAAAGSLPKKIYQRPKEDWMASLQVNLFAIIQLCSALAPIMKKRGFGRIINLSSGIAGQPDLAPYSVSKAAVDKYTKDLAHEFREANVKINYLDPGWLQTDMGGKNAWFPVDTVIPGALIPALLDKNGPSGEFFMAQNYKYLKEQP